MHETWVKDHVHVEEEVRRIENKCSLQMLRDIPTYWISKWKELSFSPNGSHRSLTDLGGQDTFIDNQYYDVSELQQCLGVVNVLYV